MKFLKRLFCIHLELELWMPLEVTTEYTDGIWICKECGKTIFKKIKNEKHEN